MTWCSSFARDLLKKMRFHVSLRLLMMTATVAALKKRVSILSTLMAKGTQEVDVERRM